MIGDAFKKFRLSNYTSVLYFIGASFAGAVLGFLMLPLFTKYLQKEDFAIVGFAMAFNAFLMPVFNLSLNNYYIKAYNEYNDDLTSKKKLVTTIVSTSLAWSLVMLVICTALGPVAFRLAGIRIPFYPYVTLLLSTNVAQILTTTYLLELRMQRRLKEYFFLSLGVSVCTILIPLGFVILVSGTAASRLAGFTVATALLAVYSLIRLWPLLQLHLVSRDLFRKALRFSAPLIPYTIFYLLFDFIDKFFVEHYNSDLKVLGYYNVAFQFANILFVFALAVYRAYEPTYYKLHYEGNNTRLCRLYDYMAYVIWAMGGLTILLLPTIVHLLTSKDYSASVVMGRWLLIISIVQAIGIVYQTQFSLAGKTMQLMLLSAGALLAFMILGYFLSDKYSYQGTIYAKLIVQTAFVTASFLFYGKQLRQSKAIYVTLFLTVLLSAALYMNNHL